VNRSQAEADIAGATPGLVEGLLPSIVLEHC
jgi:hypothetical protein